MNDGCVTMAARRCWRRHPLRLLSGLLVNVAGLCALAGLI